MVRVRITYITVSVQATNSNKGEIEVKFFPSYFNFNISMVKTLIRLNTVLILTGGIYFSETT